MQFLSSSCEPASEITERIRALVTLSWCPNLRRIDWYIGDQLDMLLPVIIELTEPGRSVEWGERDKSKVVFIRFGAQGVKEASNCNYSKVRWIEGHRVLSPRDRLVIDDETSPQVLRWRGLLFFFQSVSILSSLRFIFNRFCRAVIDG